MRLVYYTDCGTGDVINCGTIPAEWDEKEVEKRLSEFNSKEKNHCNAYVTEVEDGGLIAYLFREATRQHTYPRDAIDAALEALDMVRAEIESLRSAEK